MGSTIAPQQTLAPDGSASASRIGDGVPLIGKTGTTDNNEETWMSGASTKAATVVGVFNVTGHVDLRRTYFNAGKAATIRHKIWPRVRASANAKFDGDAFGDPAPSLINGQSVQVPDIAGKTIEEAQKLLEGAGFGFANGGADNAALPARRRAPTRPEPSSLDAQLHRTTPQLTR